MHDVQLVALPSEQVRHAMSQGEHKLAISEKPSTQLRQVLLLRQVAHVEGQAEQT